MDTSAGPLRMQIVENDAIALEAALQIALMQLTQERQKHTPTVLRSTRIKKVEDLEVAVDHLREVAVIRALFKDGSFQETPIKRDQLACIIKSLSAVLRGFGASKGSGAVNHPERL